MNRRDWEKDDFFLDQLSQGIDPSQGQDPLAAALLGLRTEIESEIPAAPELADADHNVVPLHSGGGRSRHRLSRADARRSRRASRTNGHGSGGGLGSGSGAGRRFGWGSALVGAAAATALFAVGSVSVYHATPNSPLWGVHQSLFDDEEAARVELASTLEQLEDSAHRGDEDATRQLIAEARTLLDNLRERKEAKQNKGAVEGATGKDGSANTEGKTTKPKATVTRVRPQPEGESEPHTVTETKEVTVTVHGPVDLPNQPRNLHQAGTRSHAHGHQLVNKPRRRHSHSRNPLGSRSRNRSSHSSRGKAHIARARMTKDRVDRNRALETTTPPRLVQKARPTVGRRKPNAQAESRDRRTQAA